MPGIECTHKKFHKAGEGSKECNFFATAAGDGKVWGRQKGVGGTKEVKSAILTLVLSPAVRGPPTEKLLSKPNTRSTSGTSGWTG